MKLKAIILPLKAQNEVNDNETVVVKAVVVVAVVVGLAVVVVAVVVGLAVVVGNGVEFNEQSTFCALKSIKKI